MRPITIGPNQPRRFYRGGERIAAFRGSPLEDGYRPEDWVASTTTLFGESTEGLTVLPDGRLLLDAIEAEPLAFLGAEHVDRYGGPALGLLVKLLDAGERLPVHVHPDRAFSHRHLGCAHGKTEAWLIVEAEDDAQIGLGFSRAVAEEELVSWTRDQDVDDMLRAMHWLPVRAGDTWFVPSGIPHAIGEGILLVELQEPTDLSVLLEWSGFDIDGPRDGHLGLGFEAALGAVDRSAWSSDSIEQLRRSRPGPKGVTPAFSPVGDEFFRADWIRPIDGYELEPGVSVLIGVEGSARLTLEDGHTTAIERGECVLVPFAAGSTRLEGDCMLIRCRPALEGPAHPLPD